jgi:poly(beta-D-mannuronate) C5 epimerase
MLSRSHIGGLCVAAALAAPAHASDYERAAAVKAGVDRIVAMASEANPSISGMFEIANQLGLEIAAPQVVANTAAPTSSVAPKFSLVSIDLVLSQLALQAGANYHIALRQAQAGQSPQVLLLQQGAMTLEALYAAVAKSTFKEALSKADSGIIAHVPIAIWAGSSLVLGPNDRLILDRSTGAFLLDGGRLVADGASIEGSDGANAQQPGFRPFVLVALSGVAQVTRSRFLNLGFADNPPMTGVAFVQGGTYAPAETSFIRDSVFDSIGSLSLNDTSAVAIEGDLFRRSLGPAIFIDGVKGGDIRHNVIIGTSGSHGIKVSPTTINATISDNIVARSHLNGIFINGGLGGLRLKNNLITGNLGSGIGIDGASCVSVESNALLANRESGLTIKNSLSVAAKGNLILGNRSAGILLGEQPIMGRVSLAGNQLSDNKVGVTGSSAARLDLMGNDLASQSPRIFGGQFTQYTTPFLTAVQAGQANFSIATGSQPALTTKTSSGQVAPTACLPAEGV